MIAAQYGSAALIDIPDMAQEVVGECSIPDGGLDIRSLIASGLSLAFDLTPQIQKCGLFVPKGGSYNPVTGVFTVTAARVRTNYIVAQYTERNRPDSYQVGDEMVVIKMEDLSDAGIVEVDTDSILIDGDGTRRMIVDVMADPTRQVLVIQGRKIGS